MFTKTFRQLSKHDANIAGGKGASLGEMTQAGISVPPGFVVLASSFDQFLEESLLGSEIDAALGEVNVHEMHSVEVASENIRGLIMNAQMPEDIKKEVMHQFSELGAEYVAIRSSATAEDSSSASWAGELESYLNVTKENVLESVKKCWSSLFTPRAIFYRFEKGLHTENVSVAVVVQKMVQSEVSGISFTVHPVTEDKDQMVIEAGWGLGEAIVGGKVTPDTYVIHKTEKSIMDKYVSEQTMMIKRTSQGGAMEVDVPESKREEQKLEDEKILALAELCLKIEAHYKYPQDIEWAMENNRLYITQSRPITTLS